MVFMNKPSVRFGCGLERVRERAYGIVEGLFYRLSSLIFGNGVIAEILHTDGQGWHRSYRAMIVMHPLRNSVVGAVSLSTSRYMTSLVVPVRIMGVRKSKSRDPLPFGAVVT